MSINTNVRIPMSKTASLSDAHHEATETWAEVGNYPLNNFSSKGEHEEFEKLVYAHALRDESYIKSFMEIYTHYKGKL
jgi:hypothetical protein